jgi:hypothetical protein
MYISIESMLSSQSESTMVPLIRMTTAKGLTSRHDVWKKTRVPLASAPWL